MVDLAIEKSAPAGVQLGGEITWSLTVTNNGPDPSTGSVVEDTLPEQITDPATSTPGCTIVGKTVARQLGPLAVGASTDIEITGHAPDTYSTVLPNSATVTGEQYDPDESNNEDDTETRAPPESDLQLTKTGPATVEAGGLIAWTLTVTNHGPDRNPGSTVEDMIPAGVSGPATATPARRHRPRPRCRSAAPPLRRSAAPPLRRSAAPPLRRSAKADTTSASRSASRAHSSRSATPSRMSSWPAMPVPTPPPAWSSPTRCRVNSASGARARHRVRAPPVPTR